MAAKITVSDTESVSRQDTFRVNPNDVKKGRNARMIEAPNYADTVRERAISIFQHGQLQPVEVRRLEDKTLETVFGNTRRDAVLLLREGFDAIDPQTGEKTHMHDANATLWVKVVDVDPEEAFLRGIAENIERKDTTDLQEALAQQELRTTMGWSDTRIARFYGKNNQNRVMALAKLLTLEDSVQQLVHEGKLALYTALDTLECDPETRAALLDGATDETGKVQGAVLRQMLRNLPTPAAETFPLVTEDEGGEKKPSGKRDKDDEPVEKTKRHPRNRKDLQRFANECSETEGTLKPAAAELLDILILWFADKRNDEYLIRSLNEYTKK